MRSFTICKDYQGDQSRRMRWAWNAARMADEKCTQYFGLKTWRKRSLARPRRRWEDKY